MRLVDKQVLRELAGPFVFGVMTFSSVFFAGTYLLKLTNWVMHGMSLVTAAEIVLLVLPSIVVYTLPMATLLAVLLGIGRLSGDSETVALFAGGISLYRLVVPIALFGIAVTASSIALTELVAPVAYSRYEEIEAQMYKQAAPQDQPFVVRDDGTNSLIFVKGGINTKTGVLKDVTVTRFADGRPLIVIHARRAEWAGMRDESKHYRWRLYDGWSQIVGTDSPAYESFGEARTKEIRIEKTPEQFSLYQKSAARDTDQMSFRELTELVKYLRKHPDRPLDQIREIEVDRWNKLALPISSLVFALLAAPLGIRPYRSASSVGFGLSILVIFIYWMAWHYTSSLAIEGTVEPAVGAFAADVIGILAAIILLRRASK